MNSIPNHDLPTRTEENDEKSEVNEMADRLSQLEQTIIKYFTRPIAKEAYTTKEAADRLGKKKWTVMQWCNLGQVPGARKIAGRGKGEWRIPHDVLERLKREGPVRVKELISQKAS